MLAKLRFSTIQTGLVVFWAIWLTLVTLTNFTDALRQLGVLPGDFKLASYNFDLVRKTVEAHGVPTPIAAALSCAEAVCAKTSVDATNTLMMRLFMFTSAARWQRRRSERDWRRSSST